MVSAQARSREPLQLVQQAGDGPRVFLALDELDGPPDQRGGVVARLRLAFPPACVEDDAQRGLVLPVTDRVHFQEVELGALKAGLLAHLALRGLVRGFVEIDESARQHELAFAWFVSAAREQDLPVAQHGNADAAVRLVPVFVTVAADVFGGVALCERRGAFGAIPELHRRPSSVVGLSSRTSRRAAGSGSRRRPRRCRNTGPSTSSASSTGRGTALSRTWTTPSAAQPPPGCASASVVKSTSAATPPPEPVRYTAARDPARVVRRQQQAGGGARSSSACHNRTELGRGPAGTGMADDYPSAGRFSTR